MVGWFVVDPGYSSKNSRNVEFESIWATLATREMIEYSGEVGDGVFTSICCGVGTSGALVMSWVTTRVHPPPSVVWSHSTLNCRPL